MVNLSELNAKDMEKLLQLRKKIEIIEQAMAKIIKNAGTREASVSVAVRNMRIPRSTQPSLRELITDILKESGKPMSVAEIHQASLAAGYHWRSQDPLNALNVKMYTDDTFEKVAPGKFALRAPPLET